MEQNKTPEKAPVGSDVFANSADLESLIGAAHVTAHVWQKRYHAALAEIEKLEAHIKELSDQA